MKIKIEYALDNAQFWAVSVMPSGDKMFSCGDTWEEARQRHIDKLTKSVAIMPTLPPPETIEI